MYLNEKIQIKIKVKKKKKNCKRGYDWGSKEKGQDGFPDYTPPTIYTVFSGAITTLKWGI